LIGAVAAAEVGAREAADPCLASESSELAIRMSKLAAPVERLRLVTPFPEAKPTQLELRLSELRPAGQPTVIHLYTG
jgi:hypothetical protein